MRFFRRSLIALGLAAMLPTIVLAAVGVFYALRAEGERVRVATLNRSENVMARIDTVLRGDAAVLNALATSVFFETRQWQGFSRRVQRMLEAHPHWETLLVIDGTTGEEILDLRRPVGPPRASGLLDAVHLRHLATASGVVVGGVRAPAGEESRPLVHLYQPVVREQALTHVVVLALRPEIFQEILLEQIPPGSIAAVVDREGLFIARSLQYERRLGTPATEFVQAAIRDGDEGFYRGRTYEGFENYTAFHTSPWSGWSTHIAVASTLIDTPASWSFLVAGIAGLGGVGLAAVLVILVLRDMAERRRAEESLRQSQKMEAVGQLTGGIAHDFNNLLTAVIGNLDLLRTRAAGNERLERPADRALEAARLGAKLAARLLAFSRTQRMALAPVDLQQLLKGMMGLLRQSVGPTVAIRVDIADDARTVLSEANQLELALLNLAVNARDAMPSGGVLELRSRRAERSAVQTLQPRSYVELSVSDTGMGMTEEVRSRALEPFYTTKPVGQGTGLGLSQVYGVVRESGGLVQIESAVDRGTTVKLILPLATREAAEHKAPVKDQTPTVPAARSEETACILVVDDDKRVRKFIAESLRELGYDVLDAADGASALELLGRHRVDLLIVDFAMPGMNGAEVARAAQQKRPGLPILMVSGYADSAAIESVLGNAHLLRKPFDMAELADAVVEMLGRREPVP